MQAINNVILLGRLGATPELRRTASGKAQCRLSLATNRTWKKDDEWVEQTDWHDVVLWESLAESACRRLAKGSLCAVEGRIATRTWQDDQGRKRRAVEVVGRRLSVLEKPRGMETRRDGAADAYRSAAALPETEAEVDVACDQEVPF